MQRRITFKEKRLAEFMVQVTAIQRDAQYFGNNVT
jgi:hypothetical protein